MRFAKTIFTGLLLFGSPGGLSAEDWIFDSGQYTRNPTTGKRVDQYQALPKVTRIPFDKFFSDDGPHPYAMDWLYGGGWGWYGANAPFLDDEGYGGWGGWGGGYPWGGGYIYPWGVP
jgi:hypothetical protein